MKVDQIYKSEGGYRVAYNLHGNDPITSSSPVYDTLDEARIAREKKLLKDECFYKTEKLLNELDIDGAKRLDEEYRQKIRDAKPVAHDDDPNIIPLTEYAKNHGKEQSTVRQMALRGGFQTAQKIGRDWVINADEPYPDARVKSGKYKKET